MKACTFDPDVVVRNSPEALAQWFLDALREHGSITTKFHLHAVGLHLIEVAMIVKALDPDCARECDEIIGHLLPEAIIPPSVKELAARAVCHATNPGATC